MDNYKIYKNTLKTGQIVSIVITDNKQSHSLPIQIIDYGIEGFIPVNSLTKKKRIRNINRVAPMKKILPAKIESNTGTIILTRLNINKDSDEYIEWQNGMYGSHKIRSLIKFMNTNDIKYITIFEQIIYPLQENWDNKENLFDHMKNNFKKLELDENISKLLFKFMDNTNHVKKIEYKTKFGLVATNSIEEMVEMITPVVMKYPKLSVVVDTFPYFLINSDSFNSKEEDHVNFLNDLNSIENKNFVVKVC